MSPKHLRRIAEATEDSLSYGRYADWQACAGVLANMGFGPRAITVILRSDVPRLAADEAGLDDDAPAYILTGYCRKNGIFPGSPIVDGLLEDHPVVDPILSTLLDPNKR